MSTQPHRSKLRVNCFGVSLDGYGAGPQQDLQNPLGVGGMALHEWGFPTRTFQTMHGGGMGGTTGIDEDFAVRGMAASARGFSAATCLVRSAASGPMIGGKDGGATILPTTLPCLCSLTIRAPRS